MDLNICIFGDSITWGANDIEKGGWAERIKMQFFGYNNGWIEYYNLGISGKTSENLLERFESELLSRDGNVAIIAIGINDSCFRGNETNNLVPISEFKENLVKIGSISQKLGLKKLIFVGLTRVNESLVNPFPGSSTGKSYKNHIIDIYDNAIQNFCKKMGIPYIDVSKIIQNENLTDGLHPNSEGHKKMAEKIFTELRGILDIVI